jgi:gas vesicle protein
MTNGSGAKLFCIGLGLGVTAAFLLAPQSGRQSRQYLRSKADEGKDFLKRQTHEITNSATNIVDRGVKAIRHHKERVAAAVEAGREAFHKRMPDITPERDYQL